MFLSSKYENLVKNLYLMKYDINVRQIIGVSRIDWRTEMKQNNWESVNVSISVKKKLIKVSMILVEWSDDIKNE